MKNSGLGSVQRGRMAWKTTAALAAALMLTGVQQLRAQEFSSSADSDGGAAQQAQTTTQPATPRVVNTSKIGPSAPVTYDNKYELYGGLNFMNFQAGDHLPTRMNLGGGEAMFTYWLPSTGHWYTDNVGLVADYRGEAGTTPVFSSAQINGYDISRALVYMHMGLGGLQYRGPKNQHVAVDYHALGGVAYGVFDASRRENQPLFNAYTGLYPNGTGAIMAFGGSLDFNASHNFAVRVQPDLILEDFGSEWREFVAVSGGVVWRFGKH